MICPQPNKPLLSAALRATADRPLVGPATIVPYSTRRSRRSISVSKTRILLQRRPSSCEMAPWRVRLDL